MPASQFRLTKLSRITIFTYVSIIVAWISAWILRTQVIGNTTLLSSPCGDFIYWTVAKIIIWIIPSFWLLHISSRKLREVYSIKTPRKTLSWGVGIGLVIMFYGFVTNYLAHCTVVITFDYALLNVLLIAPLFEEFLMRGVILGNLQKQFSSNSSNLIAAVMFVGLHIPGWYFMHNLSLSIIAGVFFTGIVLGFVAQRGNSVIASTLTHFFNNFANL